MQKGEGKKERYFFVHLINTIGINTIINYNLLRNLIIDDEIYKISKISAVDRHHIISPAFYLCQLIKKFLKSNLYNALIEIYKDLRRYFDFYLNTHDKYRKVIDKIIWRAFFEESNKLSIPKEFKIDNKKFDNNRSYLTDLIIELEAFLEHNSNFLKRFNYEILNFGANTDLKIKQLHKLSLNYISNLHIHYGVLVCVSADYFSEGDIYKLREVITLLFHLIHVLSVIRFNFYIHNNTLKKRRNLKKFKEFVKPFAKIDDEGFIYPILLATTYTINEKVKKYGNTLKFNTPINKRIHWDYLLPYEITGNIDIITSDKKLKKLLQENGFRRSKTYLNEFGFKHKKKKGCYRKNIRKKIVVFNKEKLEELVKNNKRTSKNTYVKWKNRKVILSIIQNSKNVDEALRKFNGLISYYIKHNNIHGITFVAKIVKIYNYLVLNKNIEDWKEIKKIILRYLKPKPKSKEKK